MKETAGSEPRVDTQKVDLHVARNLDHASSEQDYLVVKGIEHQGELHGEVVNADAEHERIVTLEMPEHMSKRLTSFFDRFLVDPQPDDWVNCHRFAVWMATGKMPEDPNFPKGMAASDHPEVVNVVEQGVKTAGPLEMGQHAVVAHRDWRTGEPVVNNSTPAEHSVIGLGSQDDDELQCIQITGIDGKLVLSKATEYIDRKRDANGRDLYAVPPANIS